MAIIALVLASKDLKLYNANPELYTQASYNNIKAGRICAIIGLILNGLIILFYAAVLIFAFSIGTSAWR